MRDTYYQSAGNPLQTARLPGTRPVTELVPRSASVSPSNTFNVLGIASLVSALLLLLYQPPGFRLLDPYDLVIALPVVLIGLSVSVSQGNLHGVMHPGVLAAVAVIYLNHRTPWLVQVLIAAAVSALLVYQFGCHAVALLTTPPMPCAQGQQVRTAARDVLLGLAAVTAVLVAAGLWFRFPLITFAALTLPLAMLLSPAPASLKSSRWLLLLNSLSSWCSYSPRNVPGILRSPAGPVLHRTALLILATALMAVSLTRSEGSPFSNIFDFGAEHDAAVSAQLDASNAGRLERLKHESVTWLLTFAAMVVLPVVFPIILACGMSTPALCDAAAAAETTTGNNETQAVIDGVRSSPDPVERESIYLGKVVSDGSPVLVPRKVYREHAHGLGDSGSGKTSLFLCPLIEQLVSFGDCSVIVLDLKADTLELLATLASAAEKVRSQRGIPLPLKYFSNQRDRATFAFNPMTQPFWSKLDLLPRTDILCGANGLNYGTDYGQGYYSSANAAVLYHALKTFPHIQTFRELADCIGNVITVAKKRDLHPEIRKAGVHVHEVIKRLANCEPLNVTTSTGHDAEVVENAIDLTQPFREPQLLYFHLSATLSPSGAPEIARLVNYILLAASTQTERKHQVYLVIDEFQRMVASNLEYMLQMARSMGVGVILANQSMEDLKKSTINLIPAIEANCRLRQWFSVSSRDDRERLIRSSGETVEIAHSRSQSENSDGKNGVTYSQTERIVPRITVNDVLLTSDHPFRSILRISRGEGYAQYGGLPVIIESDYHISEEEYRRRCAMPWPELHGSFVPAALPQIAPATAPSGPTWSQEVIGNEDGDSAPLDTAAIDSFLSGLKETLESSPRRERGKQS